jgi:predicted Zn-dependent peptidase
MRKPQHPPRAIKREVLPNGVRVISERMPHVRSVSVGICVGPNVTP